MKKVLLITAVTALLSLVSSSTKAQATMGARNGISYQISSTSFVYEASAARCGHNDLGLPNQGKFKVEVLRYQEHKDGKLIRSWTETRKTFVSCYNP